MSNDKSHSEKHKFGHTYKSPETDNGKKPLLLKLTNVSGSLISAKFFLQGGTNYSSTLNVEVDNKVEICCPFSISESQDESSGMIVKKLFISSPIAFTEAIKIYIQVKEEEVHKINGHGILNLLDDNSMQKSGSTDDPGPVDPD